MEPEEVRDTIAEAADRTRGENRFRRAAAIFLGFVGVLLAIASLAGENAMKQTINANILMTDTWAFYQARNERQTNFQIAIDVLEGMLATHPDVTADKRASIAKTIADYRAAIERFESDPKAGTGKQELLAKARDYEARRDRAQRQDENFDYARALFQISILIGSVSIVGASRVLLWMCSGLAIAATVLAINGFLLLVELPFS